MPEGIDWNCLSAAQSRTKDVQNLKIGVIWAPRWLLAGVELSGLPERAVNMTNLGASFFRRVITPDNILPDLCKNNVF